MLVKLHSNTFKTRETGRLSSFVVWNLDFTLLKYFFDFLLTPIKHFREAFFHFRQSKCPGKADTGLTVSRSILHTNLTAFLVQH